MAFLLNSQAQAVSGKNEQSTQTPWRRAPEVWDQIPLHRLKAGPGVDHQLWTRKKYTLQSQKFIKIHQFNHLHHQKDQTIDSKPRQIPGCHTGHLLMLLAEQLQCCLPRRCPKNGLDLLGGNMKKPSCSELKITLPHF